jgi:hypothetical protein
MHHIMQLRRIIGYLQKLLYTIKRIRMSPTPTLNIYLFEGPIYVLSISLAAGTNLECCTQLFLYLYAQRFRSEIIVKIF